MTEYALAPTSKFTTDSPYRTPRVMLEQGLLRAYRVRSNGTMRHLELYPLGSTAREAAEWVSDRVDMDGASVQAVARELHVSTPTIRRYLEGLELTEDIEAGDWDGLHFDSAGNPVFDTTSEDVEASDYEDPFDTDEQGRNVEPTPVPTPQPVARTRRTRTVRTTKEIVEGQGLPYPTDAERAAALADVPGAQCEPVGTTADEVEGALAASLAEKSAGWDMIAKGTSGPASCYCAPGAACAPNGGAHAPGSAGCKNAAPVRKVRSH